MNDSIGLWKTKSKKGNEYYKSNKININGKLYRLSLFMNDNKTNEKAPDMNIKLSEIKEENKQVNEFSAMNTKTEYDNKSSDIELTEKDLPF